MVWFSFRRVAIPFVCWSSFRVVATVLKGKTYVRCQQQPGGLSRLEAPTYHP